MDREMYIWENKRLALKRSGGHNTSPTLDECHLSLCNNIFDPFSSFINAPNLLEISPIIMRPISSAQRDNILSLASSGHSIRKIATQLNIPKSTVGEYLQNLVPDRSTTKTGRPSKLSPT